MLLLVSHSPTLYCGDTLDSQNTQIDDVEVNKPSRKAQKDPEKYSSWQVKHS